VFVPGNIRYAREHGASIADIAAAIGLHPSTVKGIVRNRGTATPPSRRA
jgi:plasmid maintenance system antidote protein VapI